MQIPDAKAALEKEWTKLETRKAWDVTRVKPKADVIAEALRNKRPVQSASLMDLCHIKIVSYVKSSGPTKAQSFFAVILSKMSPDNLLSSPSRELLLHICLQQNSWMLSHACLANMAKIPMP